MYDHVYLSPHFDDAPLSCGGVIHQQVQQGQTVLVITICAALPAGPLSPFAAQFHAAMGNPDVVVATRRREDKAAVERLGADLVWLDFQDALYRGRSEEGGWYYLSISEIFGTIHPDEQAFSDAIVTAINEQVAGGPLPTLYAPLTVGGHVDHQHAHRAAWALREQGWRVLFYEDYPYADPDYRLPFDQENPATLDATLVSLRAAHLTPHIVRLSEADLQARIDSVHAYGSQVPMLFGNAAAAASRLRAYTMTIDGEGPAERFWTPG